MNRYLEKYSIVLGFRLEFDLIRHSKKGPDLPITNDIYRKKMMIELDGFLIMLVVLFFFLFCFARRPLSIDFWKEMQCKRKKRREEREKKKKKKKEITLLCQNEFNKKHVIWQLVEHSKIISYYSISKFDEREEKTKRISCIAALLSPSTDMHNDVVSVLFVFVSYVMSVHSIWQDVHVLFHSITQISLSSAQYLLFFSTKEPYVCVCVCIWLS